MPDVVKVDDLEVFSRFRVALVKFAQSADSAMASAESQVSRTHSWLEGEQMSHWQSEVRRRSEVVTKAREAVRQKKLYKDFAGKERQAIEEEKFLHKCQRELAEAQAKVELVRKWLPRLEKASDLYRSGISRLSKTVLDDVPRAVALLDRLASSLEAYLALAGPSGGGGGGEAPANVFEETVSRGGEAEVAAAEGKDEGKDEGKAESGAAAAGGEDAGAAEASEVKKEQEGGHGLSE